MSNTTNDTVLVSSPTALTPWEERNGIWYKREDLHRHPNGVNGAKYRACRHLIERAVLELGVDHIVSAQSVRSPQAAITATLAQEMGLGCTIVVGASKPETAVKHPSVRIAVEVGAELDTTPRLAYNTVIQPYAARLAEDMAAWQVPYAISPPDTATAEDLQEFFEVGGRQTVGMPESVETLVIAFGSGNTTGGVLYGLSRFAEHKPKKVILVGVGPDRMSWMHERLTLAGAGEIFRDVDVEVQSLHGWFADYADLMPETSDGIVMHPTYEGKVIRYLNTANPDWWTRRNGSVGFWIVGGPM